jgi:hypothetical protein
MTTQVPHRFPGRRSFIAGSLILIVFAAIHMAAVFKDSFTLATDPKIVHLQESMKGVQDSIGPFHFSEWGKVQLVSSSYAILLAFAGVTGLLVVRPMANAGQLRAMTVANMMLCASLVAVCVLWTFPPPLVLSGLALAAFSASLARQFLLKA